MWEISKQFDFCYGHRVWSQTLDATYSLDDCLVCRHLHGHQGKITIYAKAKQLDNAMVTDFKHFNWFKKFIDEWVDHKFILDQKDPLFPTLLPLANADTIIKHDKGFAYFDVSKMRQKGIQEPIIEMYEGFILVDFVPTSEALSQWFFDIVAQAMRPLGVEISGVVFNETPKTQAVFRPSLAQ